MTIKYELPMAIPNLDRFIISECIGCDRVNNDYTCNTYFNPAAWFRNGKRCPLASHIKTPEEVVAEKKRVGQQKQKKTH